MDLYFIIKWKTLVRLFQKISEKNQSYISLSALGGPRRLFSESWFVKKTNLEGLLNRLQAK